jgi:hypothetical protein
MTAVLAIAGPPLLGLALLHLAARLGAFRDGGEDQ